MGRSRGAAGLMMARWSDQLGWGPGAGIMGGRAVSVPLGVDNNNKKVDRNNEKIFHVCILT